MVRVEVRLVAARDAVGHGEAVPGDLHHEVADLPHLEGRGGEGTRRGRRLVVVDCVRWVGLGLGEDGGAGLEGGRAADAPCPCADGPAGRGGSGCRRP